MTNKGAFILALFLVLVSSASTQPRTQPAVTARGPGTDSISTDSLPAYVRTSTPADPVIARIWEKRTQRSHVTILAQTLTDSLVPRLTGSPGIENASRWAMSM